MGGVGAGFYQLSVGIKDIGERAPTGMVKCGRKFIVKYSLKLVGAGSPINFVTHR